MLGSGLKLTKHSHGDEDRICEFTIDACASNGIKVKNTICPEVGEDGTPTINYCDDEGGLFSGCLNFANGLFATEEGEDEEAEITIKGIKMSHDGGGDCGNYVSEIHPCHIIYHLILLP